MTIEDEDDDDDDDGNGGGGGGDDSETRVDCKSRSLGLIVSHGEESPLSGRVRFRARALDICGSFFQLYVQLSGRNRKLKLSRSPPSVGEILPLESIAPDLLFVPLSLSFLSVCVYTLDAGRRSDYPL